MRGCVSCGRGFHEECPRCRKGKCHKKSPEYQLEESSENDAPSKSRRRKASREDLLDPKSTGRKRAAVIYEIDRDAPCEWRNLRNCGGGLRPIIGCYDGMQRHRHHGPVKDTTRNESGNVHRICHDCHNHWHELNDLIYDEKKYNLLPHSPIPATDQECVEYRLKWISGQMGREFELASSQNKKGKKDATQSTLPAHSPD